MYNSGFWEKAYLIEFLIDGIVEDAFTFSYPPQSEEFSFNQRINEVKTFGGVIFDDYGNDVVNINLSGTTVNQEIKIIYCSEKGKKYLNGEDEIFYLQKLIKTYGENKNLLGKKVRLYQLKSGSKSISAKWWEGCIKDFTIKRSKDAPMSYFYSLNFRGAPTVERESRSEWLSFLDTWEDKIQNLVGILEKGLRPLEIGLQYSREAIDIITTIRSSLRNVTNVLDNYVSTVLSYGSVLSNAINESGLLIKDVKGIADQYSTQVIRHVLSAGENIYNSIKTVNDGCADLYKFFRDFDTKEITADIIEEYNATTEEIKLAWIEQSKELEDISTEMVTTAKSANDKAKPTVIPGSKNEDDTVIVTYGYQVRKSKDGDTWDKLAFDYYGDATKASLLASYNASYNEDIEDINDIKTGSTIYFPILEKSQIVNNDNLVFLTPDQKDIYGTDINVKNRDIELNNGDYVTISKEENLSQAINNRLSVKLGSKIRDEVYGIRTNIGGIDEASSFILASIETTLKEEPRIKSVDNIDFKTENGNLSVNVQYTDINDNKNIFAGNF